MANVGNLRQYQLGDILRLIGDGLRRGRLVVERGGLRADLYFENGYLLHVWRSGPVPPLAQRFVNTRLLTPSQVAQLGTLANMDPNTLADSQCVQLAIDNGLLTGDQVTEWVLQDAVDLLSVLFSWHDGDYRFEEGLTPPPNRLRVALPIPGVMGTTVQRNGPWQSAQPTVQVTLQDVLDFAEMDPNDPQPVQLTRDQWRLLTLVDGESPLTNLAERMAMATQGAPNDDPQRFYIEVRRAEELVVRVASELVGDGVTVVAAHLPAADGAW